MELDNSEVIQSDIGTVGAGVGGGYVHISELHVINYDDAISCGNRSQKRTQKNVKKQGMESGQERPCAKRIQDYSIWAMKNCEEG